MGYLFLGFLYFIPFFIIGWNTWKIVAYYNRTKKFVRTVATVVNTTIEEVPDFASRPYTYFSPIIEFTTAMGTKYVLKYTEDNPDRPLYKIGEEITIYYDPSEPRKFIIYDPKAEYLVSSVWILVGLGIIYLMFFFNWNGNPPF